MNHGEKIVRAAHNPKTEMGYFMTDLGDCFRVRMDCGVPVIEMMAFCVKEWPPEAVEQ